MKKSTDEVLRATINDHMDLKSKVRIDRIRMNYENCSEAICEFRRIQGTKLFLGLTIRMHQQNLLPV